MNVSAIILAAGESKRFGENKLLLTYFNETFIEIIIRKVLHFKFDQVIIVAKDDEIIKISEKYPIEIVINKNREQGQSTSVIEGVKAAKIANDLMFFVGDQPFLSIETIEQIISFYEKNFSKIIVPLYKNKKGNPTIFPHTFRSSLLKLEGDMGGKNIISNNEHVKYLETHKELEHLDIDFKEDYKQMTRKELSYKGNLFSDIVVIRGGGDLATGVIQKLHRSGFKVLVLETSKPSAIRTSVSLSNAIYDGKSIVEDISAKFVSTFDEAINSINKGTLPLYIDPKCKIIEKLKPFCLIDAIIAKENLGTNLQMAPITIALGPGFEAGKDVDIVIETLRGHNLGRLIFKGFASENTGEPGLIGNLSKERVIYSPCAGVLKRVNNIGDCVKKGDTIAYIDDTPVFATIDGVLRGVLPDRFIVPKDFKMADVDPRIEETNNCFTISDKSRAIAGGVLEALLILMQQKFEISSFDVGGRNEYSNIKENY